MITDIISVLDPLIKKTENLLANKTSNMAETWMAIRTKMDGGKRINRSSRTSWTTRCMGAGLRNTMGIFWSPKAWQDITGTPATTPFGQHYQRMKNLSERTAKCNAKVETQQRRRKRKGERQKQSQTKRARQSYGEDTIVSETDLSPEALKSRCKSFYDSDVSVSGAKRKVIEKCSRLQGQSGVWHTERKKRLTASNVSKIALRNPKLKVQPLIKNLLYSSFTGNSATLKGLAQERDTLLDYQKHLNDAPNGSSKYCISPCGLVIDQEHNWLAASPDGVVIKDGKEVGILLYATNNVQNSFI